MYRTGSSISSLKPGIRYQVSGIRKFLLIPVFCFLSTGCGFQPVYGTGEGGVSSKLASVKVEKVNAELGQDQADKHGSQVDDREGQVLQNTLEDLLNPGGAYNASPAYLLKIKLKDNRKELGINTDLRITRYDVVPNVDYQLVSLKDNKVVDSGHIMIKSSYNRAASEFATYVAEQNSTQLADQELAEELRSRLIYYFSK